MMAKARISLLKESLQKDNQTNENDFENELCMLIEDFKTDESSMKLVLCFLYKLANETIPMNNNINLTTKVFGKLINIISIDKPSKVAIANMMVCLHVYVNKRKETPDDIRLLMADLWQLCLDDEQQMYTAVILVQVFNDFVCHIDNFIYSEQLSLKLRQLLESEVREDRKSAYYVMKQLASGILTSNNDVDNDEHILSVWGWANKENFISAWPIYITILENLEENQSHLILPSLGTIRFIENASTAWENWMNIVYKKLLTHSNAVILRWSMEYCMQKYTSSQMSVKLLQQFMEAANHTHLYNVEPNGYYLSEKQVLQFINGDDLRILEAISSLNFQPVPLHYWLNRLKAPETVLTKELLLKLAASIRVLTNTVIRKALHEHFLNLFKSTIDNLQVNDYMDFIESLHNVGDIFYDQPLFFHKLQNYDGQLKWATKRFYKIFTNLFEIEVITWPCEVTSERLTNEVLIERFETMPVDQHGWLRFLFVFDALPKPAVCKFVESKYQLDVKRLRHMTSWQSIYKVVSSKLCDTLEERNFVREKSIEFFTSHCIKSWEEMMNFETNVLELLDGGSQRTFLTLCYHLAFHEGQIVCDEIVYKLIDELTKYVKYADLCDTAVSYIMMYVENYYTDETVNEYVHSVLELDPENIDLHNILYAFTMSNELLIKALIYYEPNTGDPRIEGAYEAHVLNKVPENIQLRSIYTINNPSHSKELVTDLLQLNNELSLKKRRYYEHSKEHRIKLRICRALTFLFDRFKQKFWFGDALFEALLAPNNQLNISYIYEMLIARFAPSAEHLMPKFVQIKSYTASQQISLMSVMYTYVMINWKTRHYMASTIINLIIPLAMGPNYQVRLHAQMVIYTLAKEFEDTKTPVDDDTISFDLKRWKHSIEMSDDKLEIHLKEIRLKFPELLKYSIISAVEIILYMTNTPYDECSIPQYKKPMPKDLQKEIDEAREAFINKSKTIDLKDEYLQHYVPQTANVQIKMNPTNDILLSKDLVDLCNSEEITKDNMVVVASLITKLPYLGGIARTCEVLGIKNLILDSKLHLSEPDFKNLSMTAEKSLNISAVEPANLLNYLQMKKKEGYDLVGAEQTSHGISLSKFEFPGKCILVLGHETYGIPKNLIDILDYTVYIPQFGEVQSLSVHVTGALFMWEYCKQMK